MATILVVWTPDGDKYYSKARNATKQKAIDLAVEMVRSNNEEHYSEEEVAAVAAHFNDDGLRTSWNKLYDALVEIEAINERPLND